MPPLLVYFNKICHLSYPVEGTINTRRQTHGGKVFSENEHFAEAWTQAPLLHLPLLTQLCICPADSTLTKTSCSAENCSKHVLTCFHRHHHSTLSKTKQIKKKNGEIINIHVFVQLKGKESS